MRQFDLAQRQASPDFECVAGLVENPQFTQRLDRDQIRKLPRLQIRLDRKIGPSRNHSSFGMLPQQRHAFRECRRPRESIEKRCLHRGSGRTQPVEQRSFRGFAQRQRRIANRTIAGASAQIAAHRVRVAQTLASRPMLFGEKAHHEAGRAVSALRAAPFRDGALHRRHLAALRKRLNRDDLLTGHHRQEQQAAIDRYVHAPRAVRPDHDHRASPALTLGTAFLRSGESAGAQKIQQGGLRAALVRTHRLSIENQFGRHANLLLESYSAIVSTMRIIGPCSLILLAGWSAVAQEKTAPKTPPDELIAMARTRSANLEPALRATYGDEALKKGAVYAIDRNDFLAAILTDATPNIRINQMPRVAASKLGDLWIYSGQLRTGTAHSFTWIIDAQPYGGGNNIAAFGKDSYPQPGVPQGKLAGPVVMQSKVYPGMKANVWWYVPAQWDGTTPLAVQIWGDGQFYVTRPSPYRVLDALDNLTHQKKVPLMANIFIQPGTAGPWPQMRSIQYDTVDR